MSDAPLTTTDPAPLLVEVWTDPQCVWCFITHPRLAAAIAAYDGEVELVHRSFILHPDAPVEVDRDAHIRAQTRDVDPTEFAQTMTRLTELAAAEGLDHRPDLTRPTNSRLALELLAYAGTVGRRDQMTSRLSRAHFVDGRHIGRVDDLVELAVEAGLDGGEVRTALTGRALADTVDKDTDEARRLGALGVPFYRAGGTELLGGVQSTKSLLALLRSAR